MVAIVRCSFIRRPKLTGQLIRPVGYLMEHTGALSTMVRQFLQDNNAIH